MAWATRAALPQRSVGHDEAMRLAILLLAVIAGAAVAAMEGGGWTRGASAMVRGTFALVPLMMVGAFYVARSGNAWLAGAAALCAAATSVLVVALWDPGFLHVASTFLLLCAILILASQVMPFEIAAGLGMANVMLSVTFPNFVPIAAADALRIPYLFLFVNAGFLLLAGVVRTRDQARLDAAHEELRRTEQWLDHARHEAAAFQDAAIQAEQQHAQRMAAIESQVREQRAMLDAASHELRTPITPLRLQLAAYRLRYNDRLDDAQRNTIAMLERNLKRMAHLVDDLLDIGRLEAQGMRLTVDDFDLGDVLRDVADTFHEHAIEHGVEIHVDAGRLPVAADADRLKQVLFNLLSNALKISPAGGRITVTGRRADGGVIIEVSDEGVGLDEQQLQGLFQPFSQVQDEAVNRQGSGLGLYISQRIIEQHGGRIYARSDGPGQGATFGFRLPGGPQRRPLPMVSITRLPM